MANRQDKIEKLLGTFLNLKRSMMRQLVHADKCAATPVQIEILILVSKAEARISDIANSIQASNSAVTQQVNQLVESGFVRKQESRHDKREQLITLTHAGKIVIDTKMQLMRERVERIVVNLTDDELDQFIYLSNKIVGEEK